MSNLSLPPEWSQQSGVILVWPHLFGDWAATMSNIESTYIEIAKHIAYHELLLIVCYDSNHQYHVSKQLANIEYFTNIRFYVQASNDTWIRDYGPITILNNNQPQLINFNFNAWGNRYESELDNKLTMGLYSSNAFGNTRLESFDFILEGGSIDTDGNNGILTTTSCLLSSSRNPGYKQCQIESFLANVFGAKTFYWLSHGKLSGDDTNGHVDTLARFINEFTIVYSICTDVNDVQFQSLMKMEAELAMFRNSLGKHFELVPLALPKAIYNKVGQRLPANYTNFLFINQAVLVPTYDDPADDLALDQFAKYFPNREIIGINCTNLIQQYGSLHCATMQIPKGVLPEDK